MAVTARSARIDKPNGSHYFGIEHGREAKEELYPVLEIELPRVGTVRAQFSVDRYVHSSGWSDWRIYAREVTPGNGVGDAARAAINEAGKPLILAWLASDEYRHSRARAIAYAVKRGIEYDRPTASYSIDNARKTLATFEHELHVSDVQSFTRALDALDVAAAALDAVPAE
jgi:hypothetical protein